MIVILHSCSEFCLRLSPVLLLPGPYSVIVLRDSNSKFEVPPPAFPSRSTGLGGRGGGQAGKKRKEADGGGGGGGGEGEGGPTVRKCSKCHQPGHTKNKCLN